MNIQALLESMAIIGRKDATKLLQYSINDLKNGKGSALIFKSEEDFAQNLFLKSIIDKNNIQCFYGKCTPKISLEPYSVLKQCFPIFFDKFKKNINKEYYSSMTELESNIYKGTFGKISRHITKKRSSLSINPYFPESVAIEFSKYIIKQDLPIILYFEDIHYADVATLKILNFLIYTLHNHPILLLCSASPGELDTPELPMEFRGSQVPVIVQIKAMQTAASTTVLVKEQRELLDEILGKANIFEFGSLGLKTILKFLKKLFSTTVSEEFLEKLGKLSNGNIFFLSQILFYMNNNNLVKIAKKWKLNYKEEEIKVPVYIEDILKENLQKLSLQVLKALEYSAVFETPIPLNIIKNIIKKFHENPDEIIKKMINQGIMYKYENKLYFSNQKQRKVIVENLSSQQEKSLNYEWADILKIDNSNHFQCLHHLKNSHKKEDLIEHLLEAGMDSESMLAYPNAYEIYKEGLKLIPEYKDLYQKKIEEVLNLYNPTIEENKEEKQYKKVIKKVTRKISNKIRQKKQKTQNILSKKFLELISYYRIDALEETIPVINEKLQNLINKIVYWHPPTYFFPKLAPLLIYILKIAQWKKKIYPRDDVLFFFDLVVEKLIPAKDYFMKIVFYKELQKTKLSEDSSLRLSNLYEKIADDFKESPQIASKNYLKASFFANIGKNFLNAAHILHKNLKLCNDYLDIRDMRFYEIEILRQLGIVYENWSKQIEEEKIEEEKAIEKAVQSVNAYRDVVEQIWKLKDSSWMAIFLMKHALKLCDIYYLENDIIEEMLQTAKTKHELLIEKDLDKILIISDQDNLGACEIIDDYIAHEGFICEFMIDPFNLDLRSLSKKYSAIFVMGTYESILKDNLRELTALNLHAPGRQKIPLCGYFIYETDNCPCFILAGENPPQLFEIALEFVDQKIMRSYI